ncbi:RNA methyltransferase [Ferrimonas marina]|uniref:tRNA(Leu) C34 or U34 (Ribose-2'-O)-methylase TrmL, contains SPOUT domain n=1 Tax=Ferrimonas marina TaxID=299255 RepID=A0A1M5RJ58_9GAMM|nr:RNA methyltransferase [Ferrimonas marina]SHH26128.1 tRNA(Leu) C34 or U34 (ribose-2'-O)-methylase TrmL, contains SPOUT domain [Ferrimonas marina]
MIQIGLTNPKSPSNIGAVMRAAGCYQADAVFYTGERAQRGMKYHTDTKNVASQIPLQAVDCLLEQVPADAKLVCIELVEGATPLPQFVHPDNAFYILGPEDGSLSQAVVDRADAVVYVPTVGCMNLAATVNVVLYDRLAKGQGKVEASDALIRQSRDTNNSVSIAARSSD